jgi:hypothetical protein
MSARTRQVWVGLVNYANANAEAIDIDELRKTLASCMPWYVVAKDDGLLDQRDDLFLREAIAYQPSIKALLKWLCTSGPNERGQLFQQAYGFLVEHMKHIEWGLVAVASPDLPGSDVLPDTDWLTAEIRCACMKCVKSFYSFDELERFTEEGQKYWKGLKNGDSPLGNWTPAKSYKDLADAICDFLLTEYQRYRSRDYSRKDKNPPPAIPIFICPNCGNFVMPERVGRRKYCADCSQKARAEIYFEKASPNERRDYQWLYRLKQKDSVLRKVFLRNPKKQERLQLIKTREGGSPRCQQLIHEMRLHDAPTGLS